MRRIVTAHCQNATKELLRYGVGRDANCCGQHKSLIELGSGQNLYSVWMVGKQEVKWTSSQSVVD